MGGGGGKGCIEWQTHLKVWVCSSVLFCPSFFFLLLLLALNGPEIAMRQVHEEYAADGSFSMTLDVDEQVGGLCCAAAVFNLI